MSGFIKYTEQPSPYRHLEHMSLGDLLTYMNDEDRTVPGAVAKCLPQIEKLVSIITDKMLAGGRLFYIGAGTSGRLGVVDASECPPTFGVPGDLVTAIIAGGPQAILKAVENAEDDTEQGWKDLQAASITNRDVVIGLTASGSTPYVVNALKEAKAHDIITGCITCNPASPVAIVADHPVEVVVGPEFITGSTRMKSGTAQKLVLNMISTAVMIQLGRVEDNRMVHMQLTNDKLVDRGVRMVMEKLKLDDYDKAKELLLKYGSVRSAIDGK